MKLDTLINDPKARSRAVAKVTKLIDAVEAAGWKHVRRLQMEPSDDYVGPKGLEDYSLHTGFNYETDDIEWVAVWDNKDNNQLAAIRVPPGPKTLEAAAKACMVLARIDKRGLKEKR
jgi:hypothetical protein